MRERGSKGRSKTCLVRLRPGDLLAELPKADELIRLDDSTFPILPVLLLLPLLRLPLRRPDHLPIRPPRVLQEDLLCRLRALELRERLHAVEDPLLGVLVDGDGGELGLADADNGGHDEHRFRSERIVRLGRGRGGRGDLVEAEDELGEGRGEDGAGEEVPGEEERSEGSFGGSSDLGDLFLLLNGARVDGLGRVCSVGEDSSRRRGLVLGVLVDGRLLGLGFVEEALSGSKGQEEAR
jgi:hypothetical protein